MKSITALLGLQLAICAETFEQARQRMYAHSPEISALEARQKSYQSEVRAAQSAFYPQVNSFALYNYNSEIPQIQLDLPLPAAMGGPQTLNKSLGDHDRAEIGLDVNYLIWNSGGRRANVQAKKLQSQLPDFEIQLLKNQLDQKLALLVLQSAIPKLKQENLTFKKSQLAEIKSEMDFKIQKGVEIPFQSLSLAAQIARIDNEIVKEQIQEDSLGTEIQNLVGAEQPLQIEAKGIAPENVNDLPHFELSITRPENQWIEQHQKILQEQNTAIYADKWPKLGTNVGYRYGNPGINQGADAWMSYFQVGLQLNWKIWDGGLVDAQKSSMAQRSLELAQNINANQQKTLQRSKQIQHQWQNLQKEKSSLLIAKSLADSALVLAQKLHQKGILAHNELIQRTIDAADAKLPLALWTIRAQLLWVQMQSLNLQTLGANP